jgi:hypothetical protein
MTVRTNRSLDRRMNMNYSFTTFDAVNGDDLPAVNHSDTMAAE